MSAELMEKLTRAVTEGEPEGALALTQEALKKGISAKTILQDGLMPGIRSAGDLFSKGDYYLPELLLAGKAMQTAVEEIGPALVEVKKDFQIGKFLIGTVKGDIHDIGKNIVIMMLKANGWEVTDLGVDVSPDKVCAAIKEGKYDVFGMSTLLTVTMPGARDTIDAIKKAGLRDKIKIMIGGAPVTQEFSDLIGADGYGKDAFEGVTKAFELIKKRN